MTACMKSSSSEAVSVSNSSTSLMSIDFDGLVKGAREKDLSVQNELIPEDKREIDSPQWAAFEQNLKMYKKKVEKPSRTRQYGIDESIVDVLELCTFSKNSMANVVNAILLTFIQEHKQQLRTLLKPTPQLIQ